MLGDFSLYINPDKSLRTPGVDFGPKLSVHHITSKYLILKVGGHTAWNGRGSRGYASTYFHVTEVLSKENKPDGSVYYRLRDLVSYDLKKGE